MIRVIGVGDNTVDKYLDLGMMFPGGNAVNVAVLAHRYGHPASYVGWLGDDERGRLILNALQGEGVDTSCCRVVNGSTAYNDVSLVDGDRVFGAYDHGVCDQIALTEDDLRFISQHDLTHTSIYSQIERDLETLSDASRHLSFDFSDEWSREYFSDVLPWVDTAILSYPDRSETEELLRWIHARGPVCVLVTQGKRGATVYDGQRIYRQSIVKAEVIDTLGAGDAFAARFLVEYLSGVSMQVVLLAIYYPYLGFGIPTPGSAPHIWE
jgi:fructoselysine 6-kinase